MKLSSPTSLLLNLGHAMDHWVIAIFLYTASVIAGVWGTDWKELTPYAFGASFMFGAGSIVSGKLGDQWGRRVMMVRQDLEARGEILRHRRHGLRHVLIVLGIGRPSGLSFSRHSLAS